MIIVKLVLTFCLLYTIELNLLYTDSLNIPTIEDISLFDPQITTEHQLTSNTPSHFGHSLQHYLSTNINSLKVRESIPTQQDINSATRTWIPPPFINVTDNSATELVVKSQSFTAEHDDRIFQWEK